MISVFAICIGARVGALARLPSPPLATLAANLIGGYLVGSLALTLAGIRTAMFFIASRA